MSKKRKGSAFTTVLVLTGVLAVASAGCLYGSRYMQEKKSTRLEEMQAEVSAANEQAQTEYQAELARFRAENTGGANVSWPAPESEGWCVVDLTTFPLESPVSVTLDRQEMLYNGMLLVNQWHSRPLDFADDLPESASKYSGGKIRVSSNAVALLPDAADAWLDAITDAEIQFGYKYYMLQEGYRTYEKQESLFNSRKDKLKGKYSDEEDLIAATSREVNFPGTSEYNTGLSATIRLYKSGDAEVNAKDDKFFESEEGLWLYENSWRYGMIFRFPLADYPVKGTPDKSYKTGVTTRLRLFRYVGLGNAAAMHTLDLCLEEYIDYLSQHPHIAVFEDGALRYEIYREYVGDAESVTVTHSNKPGVLDATSSLDNMGYVITVFEF